MNMARTLDIDFSHGMPARIFLGAISSLALALVCARIFLGIHKVAYLALLIICALLLLGTAASCIVRRGWLNPFFPALCIVSLSLFCGVFLGMAIPKMMWGNAGEALAGLAIPCIPCLLACAIPAAGFRDRIAAILTWTLGTCAFGVACFCLSQGTLPVAVFGSVFAFLALLYPGRAVCMGMGALLLPLAAAFAGGIGSWLALRR